jgi:hypothetical protein
MGASMRDPSLNLPQGREIEVQVRIQAKEVRNKKRRQRMTTVVLYE